MSHSKLLHWIGNLILTPIIQIMNCINTVLVKYGIEYGEDRGRGVIQPGGVAAFQKDRASSNESSMEALLGLFKGSINLHCLSHTITHVGDHLIAIKLKAFKEDLCALNNCHGGNNKAASHWETIFDKCWKPPGNTRWWADLELYIFLQKNFDLLVTFCMTAEKDGDMNGARVTRLADTVDDIYKRAILKFELGIVTIVGSKMVKATYNLEGNSCCALITYDTVQDCSGWLQEHYEHMTFPGVDSEIQRCVDTLLGDEEQYLDMDRTALLSYVFKKGQDIILGGVKYFQRTIIEILAADLEVYKTCRYSNPISMRNNFESTCVMIDFREAVKSLNRFSTAAIEEMVGEWPKYKRFVRDLAIDHDEGNPKVQMLKCTNFWKCNSSALPALSHFARYCFTLTPSSAAAERVFSYLKNSFSVSQMRTTLEDYTQCSIMLQYNAEESEMDDDDT